MGSSIPPSFNHRELSGDGLGIQSRLESKPHTEVSFTYLRPLAAQISLAIQRMSSWRIGVVVLPRDLVPQYLVSQLDRGQKGRDGKGYYLTCMGNLCKDAS